MIRRFFASFALLLLVACNPTVPLKNGYKAGDYKVASVEITQDNNNPMPATQFADFKALLMESLTKKLKYCGMDSTKTVGITVIMLKTELRESHPVIISTLVIWDAQTREELGRAPVGISDSLTVDNTSVGNTLGMVAAGPLAGSYLVGGTLMAHEDGRNNQSNTRGLEPFSVEVVKTLYPKLRH